MTELDELSLTIGKILSNQKNLQTSFDGLHDNDLDFKDMEFLLGGKLLVAGSTAPGEESILIDIYKRLKPSVEELRLLIAPRHIERVDEIVDMIKKAGLNPVLFSESNSIAPSSGDIIVVDKIGYLRSIYKYAAIVFVGKSLVGYGGQNMIEPASFGKPVIVGPNTQNFKSSVSLFLNAGAIIQIRDKEKLLEKITVLLQNSQMADMIGKRAKDVVKSQQGATYKTQQILSDYIVSD